MNRRNLTTSFMVVGAGLLLFGGVALASEVQTREDRTNPAIVTPTHDAMDDNGGTGVQPEVGDDRGGNGTDDAATPTATASFDDNGVDISNENDDSVGPMATFDDHGGLSGSDGSDDAAGPTASPDDHGNGSDDAAGPTASPDDHGNGGNGSDDAATPRPTNAPTATATASPDDHGSDTTVSPTATASPDDHGGSGGHGGDDH